MPRDAHAPLAARAGGATRSSSSGHCRSWTSSSRCARAARGPEVVCGSRSASRARCAAAAPASSTRPTASCRCGGPCPGVVTIHDLAFEAFPEDFAPRRGAKFRSSRRAAVALGGAGHLRLAVHAPTTCARATGSTGRRSGSCLNAPSLPLGRRAVAAAASPTCWRSATCGRRRTSPPGRRRARAAASAPLLAGSTRARARAARRRASRRPATSTTPQLDALMRGAAVLVHPSLYEGFGLVVAEALARGVPVAARGRPRCPRRAATPRCTSTRSTSTRSARRICARWPPRGARAARAGAGRGAVVGAHGARRPPRSTREVAREGDDTVIARPVGRRGAAAGALACRPRRPARGRRRRRRQRLHGRAPRRSPSALGARVLRLAEPRRYAAAMNAALGATGGDAVLLLNADCFLDDGLRSPRCARASPARAVGSVAPKLLRAGRDRDRIDAAGMWSTGGARTGSSATARRSARHAAGPEVFGADGACALYRRARWRTARSARRSSTRTWRCGPPTPTSPGARSCAAGAASTSRARPRATCGPTRRRRRARDLAPSTAASSSATAT